MRRVGRWTNLYPIRRRERALLARGGLWIITERDGAAVHAAKEHWPTYTALPTGGYVLHAPPVADWLDSWHVGAVSIRSSTAEDC